MTRYALIAPSPDITVERIRAYLPANYGVEDGGPDGFLIAGEDVAGWTLDGYVIPRLASGLIFAVELEGK